MEEFIIEVLGEAAGEVVGAVIEKAAKKNKEKRKQKAREKENYNENAEDLYFKKKSKKQRKCPGQKHFCTGHFYLSVPFFLITSFLL